MAVVKLFPFEQLVSLVILNILQAINYALKSLVATGMSIKLLQIINELEPNKNLVLILIWF